jgi:hypothetical protein
MLVDIPGFSGGVYSAADENRLPYAYAAKSYNFRLSDGALRDGSGFKRVGMPAIDGAAGLPPLGQRIRGIWHYKRMHPVHNQRADEIVAWAADGYVYAYRTTGTAFAFVNLGIHFATEPTAINYRLNSEDVLLISARGEQMRVYNGEGYYGVINSPCMLSADIHAERLFAVVGDDPYAVLFSDDLDPTNWSVSGTEAGFIELADGRGAVRRVVSFFDYVYVFRDYGISRISGYGDQSQFSVTHVFTSGGRIFPSTVAVCGELIIFAATDGVYIFDGLNCSSILSEISERMSLGDSHGAYYNGRYWLACGFDYKDGNEILDEAGGCVNNTLLEYDVRSGGFTLTRGFDICGLLQYENDRHYFLLALAAKNTDGRMFFLNSDGRADGTALPKNWTSPMSDLSNPDKYKAVREIHLVSRTDCTVTVRTDERTESFAVKGAGGVQRVHCNVGGRLVSVSFDCYEPDCYISHPMLKLALSGGGI